eukprot:m.228961 g.228961  ORF g.228961 m.228961 type:complete len:785 (+) comp33549_c0_seq1:343-2697(+)
MAQSKTAIHVRRLALVAVLVLSIYSYLFLAKHIDDVDRIFNHQNKAPGKIHRNAHSPIIKFDVTTQQSDAVTTQPLTTSLHEVVTTQSGPVLPSVTEEFQPQTVDPEFGWHDDASYGETFVRGRKQAHKKGRYMGPIDVVYLWANATLEYVEKRNIMNKKWNRTMSIWSATRDNGELQNSISSVEKNLPWVRYIFIVSNDGVAPDWLDTSHPRIRVVNADKLVESAGGSSPCYNSHALYISTSFIPELSEIFIEMDDDFSIGHLLPPQFFFREYQYEANFGVWGMNRKDLPTQTRLLLSRMPNGYIFRQNLAGAHMPRTWNKTRIKEIKEEFPAEITATLQSNFRSARDIDLTSFYAAYVKAKYNSPFYMLTRSKKNFDVCEWVHSGDVANDAELNITMSDETNVARSIPESIPSYPSHALLHRYAKLSRINEVRSPPDTTITFCFQDDIDLGGNGTAKDVPLSPLQVSQNFKRVLGLPAKSRFERGPHTSILKGSTSPLLFGHQGVGFAKSKRIPANTVASFEEAVVSGVKWVELDVAITSDNIVVVHHAQERLGEQCGIKDGPVIQDTTFSALSEFDNPPPKLSEVLEKFKDKLKFQIELKQNTNYRSTASACSLRWAEDACHDRATLPDPLTEGVAQLLQDSGMPVTDVIISSFEGPRLRNFHTISPKYPLLLVGYESGLRDGNNSGIAGLQYWVGAQGGISVNGRALSETNVAKLNQAGFFFEVGIACKQCNCVHILDKTVEPNMNEVEKAVSFQPHHLCMTLTPDFQLKHLDSNGRWKK